MGFLRTPLSLVAFVASLSAQQSWHIQYGSVVGGQTGSAVAAAGDLDGDAVPDFLVASVAASRVSVVSGANYSVRTLNTAAPVAVAGTGDMNQDGRRDILVKSGSQVRAYSGASLQLLWGSSVSNVNAMAPIGDIDNDGRPDVIVSVLSGTPVVETIRTLSGRDGSQYQVLPTALGTQRLLDIGDVTGDGLPEVALGHGGGVQVLQAVNLATVVNHFGIGGWRLGAANLVGDARNEILAHNLSGLSVISATTGAILRQFTGGEDFAVVGDLDADGVPDLAIDNVTVGGIDFVSGAHGIPAQRVLARWPDSPAFPSQRLAGIGDVTGDGLGDLLMGSPSASQFPPHLLATATGGWQVLSPRILASMTYQSTQCSQGPFYPQLGITRPILGLTATVTGRDVPYGTVGFLAMSPLPSGAWNLGVPGCDVWLQYGNQFIVNQPVGLIWNYSFAIPPIPQLAGLPFALQAVYAPTASPVGFDLSNGVWARIGF